MEDERPMESRICPRVKHRRSRRLLIAFAILAVIILLIGVVIVALSAGSSSSPSASSVGDEKNAATASPSPTRDEEMMSPSPSTTAPQPVDPNIPPRPSSIAPSQATTTPLPSTIPQSQNPTAATAQPSSMTSEPSPVTESPVTAQPSNVASSPMVTATASPVGGASFPTIQPSAFQTGTPSSFSSSPTLQPSVFPTSSPTVSITGVPSAGTSSPTLLPSVLPTAAAFTEGPSTGSSFPTTKSSAFPTSIPTVETSHAPSVGTSSPTPPPTTLPIPQVTMLPVPRPTEFPSPQPTSRPSSLLTSEPTSTPAAQPTTLPTPAPTPRPTTLPTPTPTPTPTPQPTTFPTPAPTPRPTMLPTSTPTPRPSVLPTSAPTLRPTMLPTPQPTIVTAQPSDVVVAAPTPPPASSVAGQELPTSSTAEASLRTSAPSFDPQGPTAAVLLAEGITYRPGHLSVRENGLLLSEGLTSRIIARAGNKVQYDVGGSSLLDFHGRPDGAATFPFPEDDPDNPGGWVYVSNSEIEEKNKGGVGAIYFDKFGNVTDYRMLLTGTTMNCAGGRTPWNTWVSCEEVSGAGEVYQVDPFDRRLPEKSVVGAGKGRFESFTFDDRNPRVPRFFVSEDRSRGALRRFTPNTVNTEDPWSMLHGNGTLQYLVMMPGSGDNARGTYYWTDDQDEAKANAQQHYPYSEGIDRDKNILYMVCKKVKWIFLINLDDFTYERYSTEHGVFDGKPDQISRIVGSNQDILYFSEEHGETNGIHGRNSVGQFFTILELPGHRSETTGVSFSPDVKRMYFAGQDDGIVFEVRRADGRPFHGKALNVHYHNQAAGPS